MSECCIGRRSFCQLAVCLFVQLGKIDVDVSFLAVVAVVSDANCYYCSPISVALQTVFKMSLKNISSEKKIKIAESLGHYSNDAFYANDKYFNNDAGEIKFKMI